MGSTGCVLLALTGALPGAETTAAAPPGAQPRQSPLILAHSPMAPGRVAQQMDQASGLHDQLRAGFPSLSEEGALSATGAPASQPAQVPRAASQPGSLAQLTRHQEVMLQLQHSDYAYLK